MKNSKWCAIIGMASSVVGIWVSGIHGVACGIVGILFCATYFICSAIEQNGRGE